MRRRNWVVKDAVGLGMAEGGFADRLAKLRRDAAREWQQLVRQRKRHKAVPRDWHRLGIELLQGFLRLVAIVALPFVVLVRGAVFFYEYGDVPPWLALLVAALLTIGLVTMYARWLLRKFKGRPPVLLLAKWVALPLVVFYCGFSLLYLSRVNAKSDVREYYTTVHPLLRLALSTWILVDDKLVITDMRRAREDYAKMGLPVNEMSLHYRQADGWVHAVDLRTANRGWFRNRLTQVYFWAMGFSTLRHVGTADHLHVDLR
jgi:hypothetical protein